MGSLWALARLIGAALKLLRHDALIPRELEPYLPPSARTLARLLRIFNGPEAKAGRPGVRLAVALEQLGPVAIKAGQVLSTRADVFGAVFAADLGRLKDRLPPFPHEQARIAVERELGRPIEAVFETFGPAVAAASIAQAHEAVLIGGDKVAVKVLRPGIEGRIAADSRALGLAADLVEQWAPAARRLQPRAFVAEVVRSLRLELDLRLEAAAADELRGLMAKDGYMSAPAVRWDGVGKRVLTLDWAHGRPLSEADALDQPGLDRPALADAILRAFLSQALDHGVFHADLHEGNLFVSAPAQLTAVDFGIVGRLDARTRLYLAEILWGFLNRDYRQVAQAHFSAGYVPAHHDVEAFAQALRAVGEPVFGRPADQISMGKMMTQLFEITALFEMRLRPELVLLQKTMVTVEGVARRLSPTHDIWRAADPVVRRFMARELSPPAQAKRYLARAGAVMEGLERQLALPPVVVAPVRERSRLLWFAAGAAAAGLAFAVGAWLH